MSNNQWEFEPTEEDLQNLRGWLKKRPHILQDYDDEFLAAFVRGCKGNLEKTRHALENFNSLGVRYPYLFGDLDPLFPSLQEHLSVTSIFPLPKRLNDGALVAMGLANSDKDLARFQCLETIRYFLLWFYIYLWENDYGPGKLVLILDQKHLRMTHFKNLTPTIIRDLIRILQTSLPLRPKAIHFINVAPSIAMIFNMIKFLLPKKFKNKVHFHSSVKSLYEMVPKEILPKEYGGSEKNIAILSKRWKNKVEGYRDRLIQENIKMRKLDPIRPNSNDMEHTNEKLIQLSID